MSVTTSVGRPANPNDGDIWIRLPHNQPHMWNAALNQWLGYIPPAGTNSWHMAKRSNQDFDSIFVDPISGMVALHNQTTAETEWQFQHGLLYPFINVLVVKAADDWSFNGVRWTDPHATTRAPIIMVPRVTYINDTWVRLHFLAPVRGVAIVRR